MKEPQYAPSVENWSTKVKKTAIVPFVMPLVEQVFPPAPLTRATIKFHNLMETTKKERCWGAL
jgi:hypothetical protein